MEDDDPFISNNKTERSTHSKATTSVSQSLEMSIEAESVGSSRGATEMTRHVLRLIKFALTIKTYIDD